MEFLPGRWSPPFPLGPFQLDLPTIQLLVAITFLIQALIIGFHLRTIRNYPGIRLVLASTLILAAGSLVPLVPLVQPWLPPKLLGQGLSLLQFWGTALQYVALGRFTGARLYRSFVGTLVGGGSLLLVVIGQIPGPLPFVAVREALCLPLYFAVPLLLRTAPVEGFRFGALLTGIPFAGYGSLSLVRVVRGLWDPSLMQPGPSLSNDVDALLYFIFAFLWTSGFLFMLNQRLHSDLLALATRDHLTQCFNRRAMAQRLWDEQQRHERYSRPFTIAILDLDRFKAINDTMGHEAGDIALVGVAAQIRDTLRSQDSLARWGGEEFLVLLPETTEADGLALAQRLRARVEAHDFHLPGFRVTFSAGVAGAREGESVDDLCRRADQALYQAKEARNAVVLAP